MAERRGIARPLTNAAFPLTVGLLTLLAACSSPPSSPSAAATVAIPPAPTTGASESTPSPTATKPPVATSTPTPLSTPTAAMTPTPQPKPTATALPLGPIAVLNGVVLRLELAVSPSERALGLGFRESLPQDTGMLFVYGAEGGLTFWMKGMEFSIDILWLSREGTIVDISRDAAPEPGVSDGQLALYTPRSPAQYVLEINAGLSERFGFQPGDRFEFHGLPPNIQVGNGA